ncbi:putative rhamnogalacturonan acetylesterase [Lachnellula occidentalis]|uniref:Putative rhamnogalacturonan acetylesterase n=1 Tax=Lachnellula occidentalis TaxID=215460 RepID=A0A8H8S9T2_9HELO|nr:putative rhamnogalacturonan acetylesterase [Lachnellula occidentalis]
MYVPIATFMFGLALASPLNYKRAGKTPVFFLAGDSTTAKITSGGGGKYRSWGDGFLSTLVNGATGINFGHNGRTTVSFVQGGDWANVLSEVKNHTGVYDPFVESSFPCKQGRVELRVYPRDIIIWDQRMEYGKKVLSNIQFGHNDQKEAANISIAEFSNNLANMVSDVRTAGGTPILITSLSRRNYNSSGLIIEDLAPQVAATVSVGSKTSTAVLHLNEESTKYLNAVGEEDAYEYNRVEGDYTHLNVAGQTVFGNMVGWLLEKSCLGAKVDGFLGLNGTIVEDIEAGVFILP